MLVKPSFNVEKSLIFWSLKLFINVIIKHISFSFNYDWIFSIEPHAGQVQGNPGPGGQAEHGGSVGDGQEKRSFRRNQRWMMIRVLRYSHPSLSAFLFFHGDRKY